MTGFTHDGKWTIVNQGSSHNKVDKRCCGDIVSCCVILTVVVVAALPVCGFWMFHRAGTAGIVASLVGAVVCWLFATIALVVTHRFRGANNAVTGLLVAMLARTGGPLVCALLLTNNSRSLAEGGIFQAILLFYLLTLAVETYLSVRLLKVGGKAEVA